jgi:hypothetical protein
MRGPRHEIVALSNALWSLIDAIDALPVSLDRQAREAVHKSRAALVAFDNAIEGSEWVEKP